MHTLLRIMGGVGLVIGVLVIVGCTYVAVRVDRAVCTLTDAADRAIETVEERVTQADDHLKELNQRMIQATHDQNEELDPESLEITRKVQHGIEEVRLRTAQLTVALEKTLTVVDILHSLGLNLDGHQITGTLDRIEELDARLRKFSDNFAEISQRFRPDGTLREAAGDAVKERALVAVEGVLLPTDLLLEEVHQAATASTHLVQTVRSRLRWTIFLVAIVVVLITAWMTLGQLALLRGGLRNAAAQ